MGNYHYRINLNVVDDYTHTPPHASCRNRRGKTDCGDTLHTLPPEEVVRLVVHVHRPALSAGHALLEAEQLRENRLHRAPSCKRRAVASVRRDPRVLCVYVV